MRGVFFKETCFIQIFSYTETLKCITMSMCMYMEKSFVLTMTSEIKQGNTALTWDKEPFHKKK